MAADLEEKTVRYDRMLSTAISVVERAPPADTPLGTAAEDCLTMASSYLDDGQTFRAEDDLVNALASFAYGHAWLDAGARIGLFNIPTDEELFPV